MVADPSALTYWPAAQSVQAAHTLAGLPSWSHVVPVQATGGAAPPAQYVPAIQSSQATGFVRVPAAVCLSPAAQAPTGAQFSELTALL